MSDLVRNLKIKGIDEVIDVDVKITDPTLERGRGSAAMR